MFLCARCGTDPVTKRPRGGIPLYNSSDRTGFGDEAARGITPIAQHLLQDMKPFVCALMVHGSEGFFRGCLSCPVETVHPS